MQQTSLLAYQEVKKDLGARQLEVLNCLKVLGEATNAMISQFLRLPINCITPRVYELRKLSKVQACKRGLCPITNHQAIYWRLR